MKLTKLIAALFLVLVLFYSCNKPQESEKSQLSQINNEVLSNSQAYSNLKLITSDIGHRLTGSENGMKAEKYVYDLFKSYGFENVQFHEFEVEAWSRDTVNLAVNGENVLEVVTLGQSPVMADVNAELIDLGNGLRADFEANKEKVKGKVALTYIGILSDSEEGLNNIHRSEKTALAREYGAVGIVIINQVPGGVLLTGTASVTGRLIDIPAVCVSYEVGMDLKSKIAEGNTQTARIWMKNKSEMIKSRNVIATLPGTEYQDQNIMVGGHLDSWDLATGAIDNGIGIAAILDMARTFKVLDIKPKRNLQFALFMGEEQGLLGSKALVDGLQASDDLKNVRYMMNIDMSGNPKGYNASGRSEAMDLFTTIGEQIQAVDSTYMNENTNRAGLHSDHQSFMMEGVPVVGLVGNLEPIVYDYYHSNGDDFKLVNEAHLKNTVRFSAMFLLELANTDEIPARNLNFEETKQFLIEQGLREELELGNNWKWGE
jgi:hypothetical protein